MSGILAWAFEVNSNATLSTEVCYPHSSRGTRQTGYKRHSLAKCISLWSVTEACATCFLSCVMTRRGMIFLYIFMYEKTHAVTL